MANRHRHTIDINEANAAELGLIEGFDEERVQLLIDYRREHGRFKSWDDVRNVPRVGAMLMEHANQDVVLGNGNGAGAGSAVKEQTGELHEIELEDEDEEMDEEEQADPDETAALLAVAQLDLESAVAYEIAADATMDPKLRDMMTAYGNDHRRHVEDLRACVRARGAEADFPDEPENSVLVALADAMAALDPTAALEVIIGNEQLTNATYETALWVITDDDAVEILLRNREDERRHLDSLTEYAIEHEAAE